MSRPATPGYLSATLHGDVDGDTTQVFTLDATEESAGVPSETPARKAGGKSRSRSPSPSGSWFFNRSDRIICAEPMYRDVMVPKEEYDVDKGWALLERHPPAVSLKVVGRDDRKQEQHDRIYPGAWAVKPSVRGALPMSKTTGRERPASGSSAPAAVINSVEFVESLPFKSERARPASVDLQRLTGRNAPVITKMPVATSHPVDVVYNPQLNFVRQRMASPVAFSKIPGRSPPRHFSAGGVEDGPLVYDSLKVCVRVYLCACECACVRVSMLAFVCNCVHVTLSRPSSTWHLGLNLQVITANTLYAQPLKMAACL